jgi:hypothetical protein
MAHERRNIHLAIYKQTENEPKNEKQGKILQKPRLKINKLEFMHLYILNSSSSL